jgi:hypothetical protein
MPDPKHRRPEELEELLRAWQRPGGVLPRDQLRALLAWSGTPDEERAGLEAALAATEQEVEAERLSPKQRRGHVSRLDRLKHLFGR